MRNKKGRSGFTKKEIKKKKKETKRELVRKGRGVRTRCMESNRYKTIFVDVFKNDSRLRINLRYE
jgi:hypothetical protein